MTIVSQNSLQLMLEDATPEKRIKIIGRALVALFEYQTETEKASNDTHNLNSVGFSGADGKSGSLTAKYFLKHGTLLDWMVDKWMKPQRNGYARLCKYHRQLNKIAVRKAQAKFGADAGFIAARSSKYDGNLNNFAQNVMETV